MQLSCRWLKLLKVVGVKVCYAPTTILPLEEAVASKAVFVIVFGSDGRTDRWAETLLEPDKYLQNGTI